MSTGIDSWSNPGDIGPMYPFVGLEVPLVIVGVILWIAWHIVTAREENRQWAELDAQYTDESTPPT